MWPPRAVSAAEEVLVSPPGSREDFPEEGMTVVQDE